MPSSVKDRLSNTYEHIFHFVKSKKYYYNLDAIRVPHKFVAKPFNIRVRDAQKGRLQNKWGVLAHASEREVKAYDEKNYSTPNILHTNHGISSFCPWVLVTVGILERL